MRLLTEAMNGLGAVLLNLVTLLAIEELTLGGLVRLLFAPRPATGRRGVRSGGTLPRQSGREEHKNAKGESKCLR